MEDVSARCVVEGGGPTLLEEAKEALHVIEETMAMGNAYISLFYSVSFVGPTSVTTILIYLI